MLNKILKPFKLEEYLANPSRKVVTRDGRSAKIICTDRKNLNYPIVALVENKLTEGESVVCYTKEGKLFNNVLTDADLVFAPEKKEGWINLYRTETSSQYVTSNLYNSEEKAIEIGRTSENYIATTKIEWEE